MQQCWEMQANEKCLGHEGGAFINVLIPVIKRLEAATSISVTKCFFALSSFCCRMMTEQEGLSRCWHFNTGYSNLQKCKNCYKKCYKLLRWWYSVIANKIDHDGIQFLFLFSWYQGLNLGSWCILGKHSTMELHPSSMTVFLCVYVFVLCVYRYLGVTNSSLFVEKCRGF